ncbi:hypothetical protein B296_00027316 [Ensete ventricosum]|uniref:Uncharacterized protein n=1 Tax=Ensete ventricosum TaxID=4639 RepID=A0A426YNS1_ENSVE|nr:hypothetical protein B296_00027316 [Ensete ventricosum]
MSNLGHQDPDKEMKARWRGLKNSMKVWKDSSAVEEFERGLLHPQLAIHTPLRGLASPSCQGDDFGKFPIFVSSLQVFFYRFLINCCSMQNQHFHMTLFDQVYYAGRLITFMDYRISQLQQELDTLKSGEAELPRQAVDHYKESISFEGLKRMGRVTYEYGYRVALARFHALHPDSEVEEDPFTIHPEDDMVPMERQQVFDNSDPPES